MTEQTPLHQSNLADYLRSIGLVSPAEQVAVEKAGDGNINWVRRARVSGPDRSWIVKQARPALERFPEYRVSTERIVFEARYYQTVGPFDSEGVCPRVVHFDPDQRVLVLEDLGDALRLDRLLATGGDATPVARSLGAFLGAVHAATSHDAGASLAPDFANGEMRRLHGEHIFLLPLRPNDFDLSPALRRRADDLAARSEIRGRADAAYARYMEERGALVHADVQSANILLPVRNGTQTTRLLDAEIAHVGDPAFDVGVFVAHLLLPAISSGSGAGACGPAETAWRAYGDAHARATAFAQARGTESPQPPPSFEDVARYAGLELLRRTIGAARVPAVANDAAGLAVLAAAERWIEAPPTAPAGLAA